MHLFLIEKLNLTFAVRIIYLTVTYLKNVKNHFMAACFSLSFGLPTLFFHSRSIRVKKEKKGIDQGERFHTSIVHVMELVRFEAWEHILSWIFNFLQFS